MLIANNEHAMEGWLIGARRRLCEGKLWIYVMRPNGRWGLLRMLLRFVMGRFRGAQEFDIFPAEEVWVETRAKRAGIALDGEVALMHTPLHFRILSRSLRVMVPAGHMPEAE
jgi:diacylglycerol kinase family enzyme